MQFKEHEKVAINLKSSTEQGSPASADSVSQSADLPTVPNRQTKSTAAPADNLNGSLISGPPTPKAMRSGLSFDKIPAALRMLDLNPVGMTCVCAVISILLSALLLPGLDRDANLDTAAWLNQIKTADDALASRALTVNKADAKALNGLAFSYMLGDGVTVNHKKATEYFHQSANLGNTDAMLYYGILTHSHLRKQEMESQRWISKAVAAGNLNALEYDFRRNHARPSEETYKKYKPEQIKLLSNLLAQYKPLADRGDTDGIWGYMRLSRSENPRYLDKLEQNAKAGDRTAQYLIGYRYAEQAWPDHWTLNALPLDGRTNESSYDRMQDTPMSKYLLGMEYLKIAGNAGFVPAERELNSAYYQYGNRFTNPFENPQTFALHAQKLRRIDIAAGWSKRAALQNDGVSSVQVSRGHRWSETATKEKQLEDGRRGLHNSGYFGHADLALTYASRGMPQESLDEDLATLGTTRAQLASDVDEILVDSECDVESSLTKVAKALRDGEVVPQNIDLAKKLIKRLAAAGGSLNSEKIGHFLVSTGNPNEALPYFRNAGTRDALYQIGKILCRGNHTPAQMQTGIHALIDAKRKGSEAATVLLGDIYYFGRGVKPDHKLASTYYLSAAARFDSTAAMMRMGHMYEHADATSSNKESAIAWYRNALEYGNKHAAIKLKQLGASENAPVTNDQ